MTVLLPLKQAVIEPLGPVFRIFSSYVQPGCLVRPACARFSVGETAQGHRLNFRSSLSGAPIFPMLALVFRRSQLADHKQFKYILIAIIATRLTRRGRPAAPLKRSGYSL